MTLWSILTMVSTAAAGFMAALFLRRLDRAQGIMVAVAGLIGLAIVGFFAFADDRGQPAVSPKIGSAALQGASAVDQLAAAMQEPGAESRLQSGSQPHLGTVDEMIARLVDRLNRNPKDSEGWRMLGWSYFNTGRFVQSASAYAKAIELNPQNADYRSSRGEALVRAADGRVGDEARTAFEQALRLDAKDPKGRYFMGLAKAQNGDKPAALDDWIAILNDSNPADAWATDLMQQVTELGREAGVDVSARLQHSKPAATGGLLETLQQPQTVSRAAPPAGGGPSAEQVRNAEAMPESDRTAMIQGMVDRLASRLDQAPRDVEGWIKLMRARKVMGDTQAAEQTFRFALDVFKDAPREQEQVSSAARELELIK